MVYHKFIYSTLHLLFQTCSTERQPSTNHQCAFALVFWLAPTPPKSYKMFFQNVTRLLVRYCMMFVRTTYPASGLFNIPRFTLTDDRAKDFLAILAAAVLFAKIANFP